MNFRYKTNIMVVGRDAETLITVGICFTVPPSELPSVMDRVVEKEIHNAVTRLMEQAKKDRRQQP